MAMVHAQKKRFTVAEFTRLWDVGAFGHERMELIEGEIVRMTPQGDEHRGAIIHGTEVLVLALHDTHWVAVQVPLRLSELSGPEPDFFISPKATNPELPEAMTAESLNKADLVIEVAASSLAYDRDEKASLYARYSVKDYWILNTEQRQLEVHREPTEMPERAFGFGYANVSVFPENATVSPLARPDVVLRVAQLF